MNKKPYNKKRGALKRLLELPAQTTFAQVRCATGCSYYTARYWMMKWREMGIADRVMQNPFEYGSLINRDMLITYLISIGRIKPPVNARMPDRAEAEKQLAAMQAKPLPRQTSEPRRGLSLGRDF